MAQQSSFDIVSEVNMQEVDNALNQARKEVLTRYDFKDTKTTIEFVEKDKIVTVTSDDEFRLKAVIDILQNKFVKRGIHLKTLKYSEVEAALGGMARQKITLQVGIDKENAKKLVQIIKDFKIKVQAQIMDDQVRVTGKDKDDLQSVIAKLRSIEFPLPLQFTNYR
ncbi:MAG: YajQ family cyclic di-GMP-binding protein [Ignavibacteriales bacterium]|nr:YajQ family cyclic di-GMP-binding protein [Ignavibacteriales bacterium]